MVIRARLPRWRYSGTLLAVVLLAALATAWNGRRHRSPVLATSALPTRDQRDDANRLDTGAWHDTRWLAIGGGPTPEYNEASIEQDLSLAAQVLGSDGHLLFAGGAQAIAVRELDPNAPRDVLMAELGELFSPRPARGSRFRKTALTVAAAATRDTVEEAISVALADGSGPLLLYLAGHGEQGPTVRDTNMGLWGGGSFTVVDLANALAKVKTTRPVQLVVTTCFAGAFADTVFANADATQDVARPLRCGFFATSAELPASGCDPNPDRSQQESYALHFWQALLGHDRDARALPMAELDYDGNGLISPLEAHTRARIASTEVDVPTTTSERWLREKAPKARKTTVVTLVEEQALIRSLSRSTGLGDNRVEVEATLSALNQRVADAQQEVERRGDDEERAYGIVHGELLARWPVLDDPWHPSFAPMLAREREAIASFLTNSTAYADYHQALAANAEAQDEYWRLLREMAPVTRLARALETVELAGRLKTAGGAAWATYNELLACERQRP